MLIAIASLGVIAMLAFAISFVAFLVQTSRHRSSGKWAAAAGASLVLVFLLGGLANALRGEGSPSRSEGQASAPNVVGQSGHDAAATVTRVVDGDTVEISPSVEGLSTVRLIGVDTPETHGGTQPYGPEASDFTRQYLEGAEVSLELDVEKVDPYGRLLAYVYLPDGEMFNETLVEEGYAQVATFLPNVKHQERFLLRHRGRQGRPTVGCGSSLRLLAPSAWGYPFGSASTARVPPWAHEEALSVKASETFCVWPAHTTTRRKSGGIDGSVG